MLSLSSVGSIPLRVIEGPVGRSPLCLLEPRANLSKRSNTDESLTGDDDVAEDLTTRIEWMT